eukprot:TRINITY_DN2827_c0_g1_i1.p2 TRINITY_DN2827_c0_g1~~TRINITY_DN2827_c0_g1_i1.p2  ORF type:complete len:114 (+),score=2.39 TRINITY_DN2827_c0_g1_i1:149-490(+)
MTKKFFVKSKIQTQTTTYTLVAVFINNLKTMQIVCYENSFFQVFCFLFLSMQIQFFFPKKQGSSFLCQIVSKIFSQISNQNSLLGCLSTPQSCIYFPNTVHNFSHYESFCCNL